MNYSELSKLLGKESESLLTHRCDAIPKSSLHLPGPDFTSQVWAASNRNIQTIRSLNTIFHSGRLSGTGYLSILPIDQGVEHSAGASFSANPMYFDPEYVVKLAIEGGCNAVASTIGVLASVARNYAHKITFIVKVNHNELLTYPNTHDQIFFGSVKDAWNLGAVGIGATIYFGSPESDRQIQEVSTAFEEAHHLGMATVLWCYLRNEAFKVNGVDYSSSADLTWQANYIGATIQADIVKQKLPDTNGGYKILNANGIHFGKFDDRMYSELTTDHPIDLCRYQVANCFMGRSGLINSGGASKGQGDLEEVVRTAIINKRAGGTGVISGRKSFQRPLKEGIALLHAIQDVYLDARIDVA